MDEKEFWIAVRQALLMIVDAIERRYSMPRTSELRRVIREMESTTQVSAPGNITVKNG